MPERSGRPHTGPPGWRGKRALDLALVTAMSPAWAPAFLTTYFLVRATSGAPVVFRQERVGYQGRTFTLLKFRSMQAGIEAPTEARFVGWTYPSDPRITPIGAWLRKWRLDELPQFVNVLKGEMSLVGPRPDTSDVVAGLCVLIPGYMEKYQVLPGLTGLCQISPAYERFSTEEEIKTKYQLDMQYVRESSLRLDTSVLLRTLRVLLTGKGH